MKRERASEGGKGSEQVKEKKIARQREMVRSERNVYFKTITRETSRQEVNMEIRI